VRDGVQGDPEAGIAGAQDLCCLIVLGSLFRSGFAPPFFTSKHRACTRADVSTISPHTSKKLPHLPGQ